MAQWESIVWECRSAQEQGEEISEGVAREIASLYHDGQWSRGYAFASTGTVIEDDNTALWRELFPDYDRLSPDEKLVSSMIGTFLINRPRELKA